MSNRVLTPNTVPETVGTDQTKTEGKNQEAIDDSFNSFSTSDGRASLFDFLHKELRISRHTVESYCTALIENGYDDVSSLQDATELDLKELGMKIGHARRIKRAVFANFFRNVSLSAGLLNKATDPRIIALEEGKVRQPLEESLLSDYARKEISNYTPASRDHDVAILESDVKEMMIRKQAEKIASLESKLAHDDLNLTGDDFKSSSSRGGSADKRLTAEERLQLHRERKLQEEKYKEHTGKWDAPPPIKKEKSLTSKVSENDDLVMKLTSDPSFRRKIEEEDHSPKKSSRKSITRDSVPATSPKSIRQSGRTTSNNGLSRSDGDTPPLGNIKTGRDRDPNRRMSPVRRCCDTCGSNRDCEEDVDNPGTFYCKSCWEEYEYSMIKSANPSKPEGKAKDYNPDLILSNTVHHALWIAHDNPQLGDKIIYSGPRRMECILETKEPGKKDCVRIIVGDIDYSGKVQNSGIGNIPGVENEQGSECIRLRNAKGYFVDHGSVASRLSRDKTIYEFHLGDESAHLLTGKTATMTAEEFFKGCGGAIDVILDPQKDAGGWFPQKEARSGGRKFAPQFRSKGVGYIRLGDDMSENGLAFLSVNACLTFLSSVGNNTRGPIATSHSASTNKNSVKKIRDGNKMHKGVDNDMHVGVENHNTPSVLSSSVSSRRGKSGQELKPLITSPSDSSEDDDSMEEMPNIADVLKQLQSSDTTTSVKWKDKAELISQLGKGASRQEWHQLRSQALMILQDTLGGKNVNVHVLRSALIAAGMIGISMEKELVSQVSWKTMMIETIKLLKSKQCGPVAKTVLEQLHGKCFTLANSLEVITHVLGLGTVASASKSKSSRTSKAAETPKPRTGSTAGGNNLEVIEWLADMTERERNMEIIDPILDATNLNVLVDLFLSHADHRDQRCRKNVSDGLMHCVLYGVRNLGMEINVVMKMLSGLKDSNPKGWNQIFQSAQAILEDER